MPNRTSSPGTSSHQTGTSHPAVAVQTIQEEQWPEEAQKGPAKNSSRTTKSSACITLTVFLKQPPTQPQSDMDNNAWPINFDASQRDCPLPQLAGMGTADNSSRTTRPSACITLTAFFKQPPTQPQSDIDNNARLINFDASQRDCPLLQLQHHSLTRQAGQPQHLL